MVFRAAVGILIFGGALIGLYNIFMTLWTTKKVPS
jgi:hypothetical protein